MGYFDDIAQTIKQRAAGPYADNPRFQDEGYYQRVQEALQAHITGPGGRPGPGQFMQFDPASNAFTSDPEAYKRSLYTWYRRQPQYEGFGNQDLWRFVEGTWGAGEDERAAAERGMRAERLWREQGEAWEQADVEARQDREQVLNALRDFRVQLDTNVEQQVAAARSQWDTRNSQTMQQVTQRLAQMGRAADPYMLVQVGRRLAMQAEQNLQVLRMQLEAQMMDRLQWFIQQQHAVRSQTERRVMDPATTTALIQQMV